MDSWYNEIATPCPSGRSTESTPRYDQSPDEDDTAAIDFTTDLALPSLTMEKPRRTKRTTTFKIHEDAESGRQNVRDTAASKPTLRKPARTTSSMFAQPPQRFSKPRVGFAPDENSDPGNKRSERQTVSRDTRPSTEVKSPAKSIKANDASNPDHLKKDRRRNTIYIPPEDTTVPSVFMGIFSPLKDQTATGCAEGDIKSCISPERQMRRSLPVSPHRSPLQRTYNPPQETRSPRDVAGQKTGKENVPPGGLSPSKLNIDKVHGGNPNRLKAPTVEGKKTQVSIAASGNPRPKLPAASKPTGESRKLRASKSSGHITLEAARHRASNLEINGDTNKRKPSVAKPKSIGNRKSDASSQKTASKCLPKPRPPKKSCPKTELSPTNAFNIDQKYPVISENILNPSMYEERWLEHQEIVIVQLVNNLFDSSCRTPDIQNKDIMRDEFLTHYQSPYFSLLHKRALASLLHGPLRVPRDILRRGNRMKDDLGFRRKFLDLWLETYNLFALRGAAEAVVGRRITCADHSFNVSTSPSDSKGKGAKALRREIQSFLETFLLRNEDADGAEVSDSSRATGNGYRKTLLRSIMLIILLDKAKTDPETAMPHCLFLPSSKYKSSAAAMQALGGMLLPATDIIRSLGHLDCQLIYQQSPLQEYEYRISNLAVDVRDGVILTRLVELLFFSPGQPDMEKPSTISLATGEVFHLSPGEADFPLSEHLKIPCKSRAAKVFNVQVALGALSSIRGMAAVVHDISPANIVDGYREKTIALLWSLVRKWGLSALIDWKDVRREIARLGLKYKEQTGQEVDEIDEMRDAPEGNPGSQCSQWPHQRLLEKWASRLAVLKGCRLENLTTSLTDGRIFESIIDEYEGLIRDGSPINKTSSVESRLRSLGCSAPFASLVAPRPTPSSSTMHIFDQDFTLAAIAFLCSRLLPASRHVRAAITIQAAWRRMRE